MKALDHNDSRWPSIVEAHRTDHDAICAANEPRFADDRHASNWIEALLFIGFVVAISAGVWL